MMQVSGPELKLLVVLAQEPHMGEMVDMEALKKLMI